MCGIAGFISNKMNDPDRKVDQALMALAHRGPDGKGVWMNKERFLALGHRRLSIIDLSEAAAQPMGYLQRYQIIHNGELYNYLELKKILQQKGMVFFTESDTEVIAAAFHVWKADCLEKFDGMFAFAIWDEEEKQLFAARDRFGEKPFYFYHDDECFAFASEQKALWRMGIQKNVNPSMLYNFLSIGYTTNPSDQQETFYLDIYKLPPACYLIYDPKQHKAEINRYWQIEIKTDQSITEKTALEKFEHLLRESVKKRLRSDVSIGTSLSGGLDSSAIVLFCDSLATGKYSHTCFTASFEGFDKNELGYAQKIAHQFGLDQKLIYPEQEGIVELMEKVMYYQDEPVGSASALAQFCVYKAARESNVTVLLDGQGADELLGGYQHYYTWFWQELYRKGQLKKSGEKQMAEQLGIQTPFSFKHKVAALFPEFAAALLQSSKSKNAYRHPDLDPEFAFTNKRNLYYATPSTFDLNRALFYNTFVNGLEELLRIADRNSMAHGTEVRLPFLNHELAGFLFSLPSNFKINQGWTKWILRKTLDNRLPPEIVWRKDKIGFEPPQKKWMEDKLVNESIMEGKKKLIKAGILNAATLKKQKPHSAYAADGRDWRYWSSSYLFD